MNYSTQEVYHIMDLMSDYFQCGMQTFRSLFSKIKRHPNYIFSNVSLKNSITLIFLFLPLHSFTKLPTLFYFMPFRNIFHRITSTQTHSLSQFTHPVCSSANSQSAVQFAACLCTFIIWYFTCLKE